MAHEDLTTILRGYSKAMYATWFYYKPDHLLFDAGEGVASHLDNGVFGIQWVLLSHGHIDHLSGLPTLVHIRSAGMGEKTKPLTVYYPEGDRYVQMLSQYVGRTNPGLTFELTWETLQAGQRLELSGGGQHGRVLETFRTQHVPGRLSLGFNVLEKRRKLRPEFAHLSEADIRAYVRTHGREDLTCEYEQKLLSYAGDSMPVQPEDVRGTDLLLHEATFLTEADRERKVHATLEETLDLAAAAEVKGLVLFHISSRYPLNQVRREVRKQIRRRKLEVPVWALLEEKLERVV
jgi:ribonuclease Z